MIFAVCKVQPIFSRQHLANFLISAEVVLITNRLAIIVHPIEDDVAMRMFTVNMSGDDVLRVQNTHQLHVVMSDLQHQRIIMFQAVAIFGREVERGVSEYSLPCH